MSQTARAFAGGNNAGTGGPQEATNPPSVRPIDSVETSDDDVQRTAKKPRIEATGVENEVGGRLHITWHCVRC